MKSILAILILFISLNTQAALVYLNFEGHVTETSTNFLDEQFSVGDRFQISVAIETTKAQTDELSSNQPWFGNAVNNLRVTSGDFFTERNLLRRGDSVSGEGSCGVLLNKPRNQYNIQGCTKDSPFVGYATGDAYPTTVISDYFELTASSADPLNNLSDIPMISDGANWEFRHHFYSSYGEANLSGNITRMSVSEPASFALLGLGLAGLAATRKKK